ncbi:MAG: molybdenum cofactor guanylyltransferase [SAR202 cluster bacterium]|nr:molybdenum cofactor guanylyltransferase [SAR202 cluster bacterium]
MGVEKASLLVGGRTMLSRVVEAVSSVAEEVLVVRAVGQRLPDLKGYEVRIVEDEEPHGGPLGGLVSGLRAVKGQWALVVGCDMPFLDQRLLQWLVDVAMVSGQQGFTLTLNPLPSRERKEEPKGEVTSPLRGGKGPRRGPWDAVVPVVHGRAQVLHAVWSRGCLGVAEGMVSEGKGLRDVLGGVRVKWVEEGECEARDPGLRSVFSVDTPGDWALAEAMGGEEWLLLNEA